MKSMIILFITDQQKSKMLYKSILGKEPILDVIGMTEFKLSDDVSLGLMPRKNIHTIISADIDELHNFQNSPVAELYLRMNNSEIIIRSAIDKGAKLICPMKLRSWGDEVAYLMDYDGNIIGISREKLI